jgi:hypothetical protein
MNKDKIIIQLNTIWYDLIAGEYHKDRDCHFYIYSHYFYGDDVEYMVEHKGYIEHNYEDTYWNSYDDAQRELIRLLKEMIIEESSFYIEHYGEEGWDQHPNYNKEQLEEIQRKVLDITEESLNTFEDNNPLYKLH